jgi:hypothetical protein
MINEQVLAVQPWVTPTFVGNWVSLGMAYTRDIVGFVTIKGACRATGPGATGVIFNLPAGFRPGVDSDIAVVTSVGGAGYLHINSATGDVSTVAAVPAGQGYTLSSIRFLAEL